MTVLLTYTSGLPDRKEPYISLLPCGLCYLHSALKEAGINSRLANLSAWPDKAIRTLINDTKPSVIAISQWTHNRIASLELARLVRRIHPHCLIVFGGGHATFQYEEVLMAETPVDLVVRGEGEQTLLEVVRRYERGETWRSVNGIAYRSESGVVVTPDRELLTNLDELPFASSRLEDSFGVDLELQAEFIITARGCPSSCSFCSSPAFWRRKVRYRSPEHIVREILEIRKRFGLIYFSLRDDTFTANRDRTIEFCRLLIERKAYVVWNCQSRVNTLDEELLIWMKRAGCECVQLGVESGSPRILELLNKKITPVQVENVAHLIKHVGINLSVYMISDIPGETEQDRSASMALLKRILPDDGYVSPLAYYPGTKLFENAVTRGDVPATIFQQQKAAAVYAGQPQSKFSRNLLKVLNQLGGMSENDIQTQKQLLGYCYVTQILVGEQYRRGAEYGAAEREFAEIVKREPENPWGWFLLGELYAERNKRKASAEYYRRVIALVPNHGPSLLALGQDKRSRLAATPYAL